MPQKNYIQLIAVPIKFLIAKKRKKMKKNIFFACIYHKNRDASFGRNACDG